MTENCSLRKNTSMSHPVGLKTSGLRTTGQYAILLAHVPVKDIDYFDGIRREPISAHPAGQLDPPDHVSTIITDKDALWSGIHLHEQRIMFHVEHPSMYLPSALQCHRVREGQRRNGMTT